jgi:hypothetical protein
MIYLIRLIDFNRLSMTINRLWEWTDGSRSSSASLTGLDQSRPQAPVRAWGLRRAALHISPFSHSRVFLPRDLHALGTRLDIYGWIRLVEYGVAIKTSNSFIWLALIHYSAYTYVLQPSKFSMTSFYVANFIFSSVYATLTISFVTSALELTC